MNRGIFAGGHININTIEYITISTTGDTTDFGDLLVSSHYGGDAASNGANDRGVVAGGDDQSSVTTNVIEYITMLSPGNAQDFGDLTQARQYIGACDNGTGNRGVFGGGEYLNIIDYITISVLGDAANFGDMSIARRASTSTSNDVNNRGVFAGGQPVPNDGRNIIDYITISTTGDAQYFGDLTFISAFSTAISNGTDNRGLIMGSYDNTGPYMLNNIDYITISSLGNAQDFGDLSIARYYASSTSNA